MGVMDKIVAKIVGKNQIVVLPEGMDSRVIEAAAEATKKNYAKIIVLATDAEIAEHKAKGLPVDAGFEIIDWTKSGKAKILAAKLLEMRKSKGMTEEEANKKVLDRLFFGALMVKTEMAQGLVAGSIASTGDMLRSAFQCVGTAPGIKTASSNMVLQLKTPSPAGDDALMFADCAVNPNPDAQQLADIALSTVIQFKKLIGGDARVAMLSFSSYGSANHENVTKIQEATKIAKSKIAEFGWNDVEIDGEMQADAAIVPSVGAKKTPGSKVGGKANVLIFPDLQAGNISYKLIERLAGAEAYGPILQGLAAPINDLSRGCSAKDIVGVIAITACQALS